MWRSGKLTLYRYRPIAKPAAKACRLLIVYALVNRPYMMDLQEDRSLIRGLLASGLDVYLIDWGYPDGADRFTTLADYIDDYLAGCVDHILKHAPAEGSQCARGLSGRGAQLVLFRAASEARAKSDHHGHAGGFPYPRGPAVEVGQQDRHGGLGGRRQRFGRCAQSAVLIADAVSADAAEVRGSARRKLRIEARIENFMRVEQWIFDSPDQAGAAFREFVRWFYQENRLVRKPRSKSAAAKSICTPYDCRY